MCFCSALRKRIGVSGWHISQKARRGDILPMKTPLCAASLFPRRFQLHPSNPFGDAIHVAPSFEPLVPSVTLQLRYVGLSRPIAHATIMRACPALYSSTRWSLLLSSAAAPDPRRMGTTQPPSPLPCEHLKPLLCFDKNSEPACRAWPPVCLLHSPRAGHKTSIPDSAACVYVRCTGWPMPRS